MNVCSDFNNGPVKRVGPAVWSGERPWSQATLNAMRANRRARLSARYRKSANAGPINQRLTIVCGETTRAAGQSNHGLNVLRKLELSSTNQLYVHIVRKLISMWWHVIALVTREPERSRIHNYYNVRVIDSRTRGCLLCRDCICYQYH